MDKLTELQTKFETALNETPNDVDILSPLVEEAGALIAKANMNRVSQPVTPESPEPEKETVVVKEKTTVLTNNKKTKKTAKTPQTGDPVSATALLLMLGASAGVIGKMKKKKEE